MLQFPSSSQSIASANTTPPRLRKSHSLSSISSSGSLHNDVLELSSSALKSQEQSASIEELSGAFDEAAKKYTSTLRGKLMLHGEHSTEVASTRLKLIQVLSKSGQSFKANYHIGLIKESLTQSKAPQDQETMKSILAAAEKSKHETDHFWRKALEPKLRMEHEIRRRIEQEKEQKELEDFKKEQQVLEKQKRESRKAQKEVFVKNAEYLKGIKINRVNEIGFCNDIHLQKKHDKRHAETLIRFNHGERLSLGSLNKAKAIKFADDVEQLLTKIPHEYEVTPASNGSQVEIKKVKDLLPSKILKHVIASKALAQWKMADNDKDKEAWAEQINEWFGILPETVQKQFPDDKSLYDLFMGSEKNQGLDGLAGMQDIKNYVLDKVIAPQFDYKNTQGYRGILLHGAPGNGKSALSNAIAHHTGFNLYTVRRGGLETTYKNGVAETIAKTLKHAKENSPSVVILEEVDSIAGSRDNTPHNGGSDANETTAIMNCIDEIKQENPPYILIATTNYPHKLDKAFRREGRFHDEVEIHNPDQELRKHLFETYLKGFSNHAELASDAAKISEGLTSSAIQTICEFDIGNDSTVKPRFTAIGGEAPATNNLTFEKLKQCIERRKNKK